MKYNPPSADLFIRNRRKFASRMAAGHVAVFFANDLVMDNADSHYRFSQNSDLYYLTGIDQEEVILVLFPDAPREEWKEVLFVRKTSELIQVWEGWKYSPEEATAASGIQNVRYVDEFRSVFRMMVTRADGVYHCVNEHERNSHFTPTEAHRFAEDLRREFPGHAMRRAAPILENLRALKEPEEIVQMREAISITDKAFRRLLRYVRPGVTEYGVEAEILHEFLMNRATGPAYQSIVASGANACVLHYVQNDKPCRDGDVLLLDFGAEYGNYSADLSRSIPVNGRFTPRQRQVYDACLRVFRAASKLIRPGATIDGVNKEVGLLMQEELLSLGLITKEDISKEDPKWPAYKKHFMHGTTHHLGLDTHDAGDRYAPMQPGMVFTCEPGIYIAAEKLGIRIENDLLVTADGNEDLMPSTPIEAGEIEELMNA
jgi:Xaa-Pro aminopeptidase